MIKSKKQSLIVIGAFTLVMLLGTVTYAFFNYTRTGSSNVIKTGRISFTSSQDGNINLTNVFPITSSEAETDTTNTDEVVITITGDTTYTGGIEYLVTLEDVKIETSTNKKIPVGLIVTPEVDDTELGTENTNYFNTGVRGGNTSYYKVLADNTVKDGEYVLVGYIKPGQAEVNGKIGIKAYLDASKILISDTYDGTESETNGTPNSMAEGKTVLTTNEWNSIQGNNAISFKVRVQANEGIWVGEPMSRNDMKAFPTEITSIKSTFTEINFIRMSEEMIDTHADLIDLTADGGQGVVKAWVDGTKLYIASPGETYFPVDSTGLFGNYSNVTRINFNNINTDIVENMQAMFSGCGSLTNIDLSSFNTSSVTDMLAMFSGCSSLTNIDLSSFNTSSVTNMFAMFGNCSSLTSLDLSGFDTRNVTNMSGMFNRCSNLTNIDFRNQGNNNLSNVVGMFDSCTNLKEVNMSGFNFGTASMSGLFSGLSNLEAVNLTGANTGNVTDMGGLFNGASKIENVNLSGLGGSNLNNVSRMFYNCINLKEVNMSGFNFGNNTEMDELFKDLINLEVVDLSNVIITNITNMNALFYNDSKLKTVYVSNDWSIGNNVTGYSMFVGCTSLVGGSGTPFDSNYIHKEYAHIDGGTSNPGYFTLKTN